MEQLEKGVVRSKTDGESPVTTFYLRAMSEDSIEQYGLTKYLRKEVKSDEQGS